MNINPKHLHLKVRKFWQNANKPHIFCQDKIVILCSTDTHTHETKSPTPHHIITQQSLLQ